MPPRLVEPLSAAHRLDEFDCGKPPLDDWLKRHALASQAAGSARCFVIEADGPVVGYYALAAAQVAPDAATERLLKGQPRARPIAAVLLARLAVDARHQGRGLGVALLRDALRRVDRAADEIGVRTVLVHAKDEEARRWYEQFGFEPSPADPLQLVLLMKDLRAFLARLHES
jgi:GNAT superfamily N-acetyltransferase